jgi:SOS-response transcriptional repressor LexA
MESLTDIQQKVYDYTRQAIREGRPFPSLRDIATRFGFQHTTARFHLKALEKKGYIRQRSQRVSDYMLADEWHDRGESFDLIAQFPPARRYPYSMNRVNRFR